MQRAISSEPVFSSPSSPLALLHSLATPSQRQRLTTVPLAQNLWRAALVTATSRILQPLLAPASRKAKIARQTSSSLPTVSGLPSPSCESAATASTAT